MIITASGFFFESFKSNKFYLVGLIVAFTLAFTFGLLDKYQSEKEHKREVFVHDSTSSSLRRKDSVNYTDKLIALKDSTSLIIRISERFNIKLDSNFNFQKQSFNKVIQVLYTSSNNIEIPRKFDTVLEGSKILSLVHKFMSKDRFDPTANKHFKIQAKKISVTIKSPSNRYISSEDYRIMHDYVIDMKNFFQKKLGTVENDESDGNIELANCNDFKSGILIDTAMQYEFMNQSKPTGNASLVIFVKSINDTKPGDIWIITQHGIPTTIKKL